MPSPGLSRHVPSGIGADSSYFFLAACTDGAAGFFWLLVFFALCCAFFFWLFFGLESPISISVERSEKRRKKKTELLVHLANFRIAEPYKAILEDIGRKNGMVLYGLLNRNPFGHGLHIRLVLSLMSRHNCLRISASIRPNSIQASAKSHGRLSGCV